MIFRRETGFFDSLIGTFKSVNNATDRLAELQAMTFFSLLEKADLTPDAPSKKGRDIEPPKPKEDAPGKDSPKSGYQIQLRHNIEIHLPATKDIEVYNAIFKALKEHLVE